MPSFARRAPLIFGLALLAGANLLVYLPSLTAPFYFDDFQNIVDHPAVARAGSGESSLLSVARPSPRSRRPLAYLSFALNLRLFGLDPLPFHAVNLIIHLANSFLVFGLLRKLLQTQTLQPLERIAPGPAALAGALFWSVHPVHTQAVTYLVQRMTSLAALFYLLALWLTLQGRSQARRGRKLGCFCAAGLAALGGFGVKEIILTLPLVLLLAEFSLFPATDPRQRKKFRWFLAGGLLAVYALLFLLYGPEVWRESRIYSQRIHLGLADRLLTQARVIVNYLTLLAWPAPARLNLYPQWDMSTSLFQPAVTFPALLFVLGVAGLGLAWLKRLPLAGFAVLFFLVALLPEAGIFPLDPSFEHRLYLPSVGLLALGGARWVKPGPAPRLRHALFGFSVVALGALTFLRNCTWTDEVRLWQDTVKKSPGSVLAWTNLAGHLVDLGRYPPARFAAQRALELQPCTAMALSNLGAAYLGAGRFAEAREVFARLKECGAEADARAGLELAAELERDSAFPTVFPPAAPAEGLTEAERRFRRGFSRMREHRYAEAVRDLSAAVRLKPDLAVAYVLLSKAHLELHQLGPALAALSRAEELLPTDPRVIYLREQLSAGR